MTLAETEKQKTVSRKAKKGQGFKQRRLAEQRPQRVVSVGGRKMDGKAPRGPAVELVAFLFGTFRTGLSLRVFLWFLRCQEEKKRKKWGA